MEETSWKGRYFVNFETWFLTFVEEKEIDMSIFVTAGDGTELQVGDICTVILNLSDTAEQEAIKRKLVYIDFKNGDVIHFLSHLAKALNASHKTTL